MTTQIGKYRIQSELARGGFARVYRAIDPAVGRPVAIKVLEGPSDSKLLARFNQEAAAAGNLHHHNIVTIYEFGEHEGTPFLAMEFLDGRNLKDLISQLSPAPLLLRVQILSQIASGLAAAHSHGVVHRDIKPSNVMVLPDQSVKLMDFGIARVARQDRLGLTQSGELVGTVLYMAPEQFHNAETDALSDIFSFGVLSYELLTGLHPFPAEDLPALMYRVMHAEPARISAVFPECPSVLEAIVFRALEKDRRFRYQTMADLRLDLEPVLRELQQREAAAMLADARNHLRAGRLAETHALVRSILALDPGNVEARDVRAAVIAGETRERVESLMRAATGHMESRRYEDAVEALELVRRLAPGHTEAESVLQSANQRLEARQRVTRLTGEASRMAEQQDFAAAAKLAAEAAAIDPEDEVAQRILASVEVAAQRQESQRRVKNGLTRARGLLLIGDAGRALTILEELQRESEHDEALEPAVATVRAEILAIQNRRREDLDAARQFLENRSWPEALQRLEETLRRHPCDADAASLVRTALEQRESAQEIQRICETARVLVGEKLYEIARFALNEGLSRYPGQEDLMALKNETERRGVARGA